MVLYCVNTDLKKVFSTFTTSSHVCYRSFWILSLVSQFVAYGLLMIMFSRFCNWCPQFVLYGLLICAQLVFFILYDVFVSDWVRNGLLMFLYGYLKFENTCLNLCLNVLSSVDAIVLYCVCCFHMLVYDCLVPFYSITMISV